MTKGEYDRLSKSLEANGQLESVKLLGGQIIDGRHRYRYLQSIDFPVWVEDVTDSVEPAEIAKTLNLDRRHLSKSQIAQCAARFAAATLENNSGHVTTVSEESGKRGPKSSPRRERMAEAADAFGVSERQVRAADAVEQQGSAKLKRAVRDDKLPVRKAEKLATLPKAEQDKALAAGDDEVERQIASMTAETASERANGRPLDSYDKTIDKRADEVMRAVGALHRAIDDRAAASKSKKSDGYYECRKAISGTGGNISFVAAMKLFNVVFKHWKAVE